MTLAPLPGPAQGPNVNPNVPGPAAHLMTGARAARAHTRLVPAHSIPLQDMAAGKDRLRHHWPDTGECCSFYLGELSITREEAGTMHPCWLASGGTRLGRAARWGLHWVAGIGLALQAEQNDEMKRWGKIRTYIMILFLYILMTTFFFSCEIMIWITLWHRPTEP